MTAASVPNLVAGLAIGFYWYRVCEMAARAKRRSGRAANFIPQERTGRLNRFLWMPAVAIWIAHPLYSAIENHPPFPLASLLSLPVSLSYAMSCVIVACVALTTVCWKRMGKSWRMGIDPSEKTSLIVTGPYEYVRHPIYALSLLMMLSTMVLIVSPVMIVAGFVHGILLVWEAKREEQYLETLHGDTYRRYCSRVGRFVPVLARRRSATAH